MKNAMRLMAALVLALLPAWAMADDAVLLVELPESAQQVENVSFEDGDFVQSYQLEDGSMVMLLRYGEMNMTAEELAASDWAENEGVTPGTIAQIDGYPAQHVVVRMRDETGSAFDVNLILVSTGDATLIMQMTSASGADVSAILDSLHVQSGDAVQSDAVQADVG